jgi:hypothetical protein
MLNVIHAIILLINMPWIMSIRPLHPLCFKGKRSENSDVNWKICSVPCLSISAENDNKAMQEKKRITTVFSDLPSECGSPSCDVIPTSHGISHKPARGFFMMLMGLSCSRGFFCFGTTSSSTGRNGYENLVA